MSTIQTTNIKHNASASNNITLDSAGNVGVGTATPAVTLEVNGNIRARAAGGEGGELQLNNPDNATVGAALDVSSSDLTRWFTIRNNSQHQIGQLIGTGGIVTLHTAGVERVRVDSSGNVGIGTTSPAARLQSTVNTNNGAIGVAAILDAGSQNPAVAGGGIVMNFRTNSGTSFFGAVGGYTDGTNNVTGIWGGAAASGVPALFVNSAGNLAFNSGYGSTAVAFGCRVWVNFNGTGTVAIRGSGNVSSITDNGVGVYTVNFTTALPDTNYSVQIPGSVVNGFARAGVNGQGSLGTGSVQVTIGNDSGGAADRDCVTVAIFR